MSAPASEELRELERLLWIAAESGEPASLADLQTEMGLGAGDLREALDTLREHGKASEVAPGQWSGPDADAVQPAEPAPVRVSVPESDERDGIEVGWAPERGDSPPAAYRDVPTVRLTMAIARAMSAEALGQLVKAGIDDAATRSESFYLEVL